MYIKLSNVSKQVPDDAYVQLFIKTVDEHWARVLPSVASPSYVGVHCHYGFNRTGFMLCCYMVERCGYSVQKAIDAVCAAGCIHHVAGRCQSRTTVAYPYWRDRPVATQLISGQ